MLKKELVSGLSGFNKQLYDRSILLNIIYPFYFTVYKLPSHLRLDYQGKSHLHELEQKVSISAC